MKRILVAAVGATMCLHGASTMAADIKVGSAGGITGPIAELVVAILAARDLAASHVNEQGGLLGGDTYQLVRGDSQCDPKAAVDAGTKLVNVEQVVAVIGPSCSGVRERHGPVGQHSVRRGDGVRYRDRTEHLGSRRQRPRVPGCGFRRLPGAFARRARVGAWIPLARRHLLERRLQRGPGGRVRGLVQGTRRQPSPQARRTSPTRHRTAPSFRRCPAEEAKDSRCSPITVRAASPSSATAWRTGSSESSWALTA